MSAAPVDVLDQLLAEALPGRKDWSPPAELTKPVVQKLNYSHNAMIDLIIASPGISQNEIAARFGYTPAWISRVMVSDAFQAALAERSAEVVDPQLVATVKHRFEALVLRSQELLMQKLDRPATDVPDQLVLRALELSSRGAGYGAKVEAPPPPGAGAASLELLAENILALQRRVSGQRPEPINVTHSAQEPV